MVLKQRANFYNNISTEMVTCQKPMLLQDAIEFEKVWRMRFPHPSAQHCVVGGR